MKRTVLLSLGFAAALVASAGIKDAAVMKLPQMAENQAVKVNKEQAVVAQAAVNSKILSSEKLVKQFKNMGIYQTKDGKYVRVLNKNNKLNLNQYSKPAKLEVAANASFSENFDGWNGTTENWLPNGWTQESKVGTDASFTWGVIAENFYAYAYDGYSLGISAFIEMDPNTNQTIFKDQDEWCYSPAFTVAEGDFLSFYLNYDPGYTLLNWDKLYAGEFAFDSENTNLEVLVSADDGASWTKLWDAVSDAQTLSEVDLYNVLGTSPWKGVVCDMSAYAGKSVKLAFRFVGKAGNDMMIDNLAVGEVNPVASYSLPANMFVNSAGENESYYPYVRLAPAYATRGAVFTNNSQMAESYEWAYLSPEDASEVAYSYETNLSLEYPFGQWTYPELKAIAGENESSYQFGKWENNGTSVASFWQTGGFIYDVDEITGQMNVYPVVNWERYYLSGLTMFSNFRVNGADSDYSDLFGDELEDGTVETLKFDSFATLIETPDAPYAINGVYLSIGANTVEGDQTKPIRVSVYNLTNEGTRGELLGSGECYISDNIATDYATTNIYLIPCYFTQQVGLLTQQVPLTIDGPVLVCLSAEEGLSFAPVLSLTSMTGLSATGYGDGLLYDSNYILLEDADGQIRYYSSKSFGVQTESGLWNLITGIGMEFDVFYNWLYEESNNYVYKAPASGGESDAFTVNSYYSSDYWTLEGDGLYDWVDYTTGEYDTQTGRTELIFTVQPLPAGETGRKTMITISTYGAAPLTFGIYQGDAGVEAVEVSANKVNVVNGNFEVEAASATSVDVYNVSGQKVASAAIEGTTVVPAQDLAKGMYILKFNDNTAVKVMK